MFDVECVKSNLDTAWLGRCFHYFESIDSTNAYLRRLLDQGEASDGVVACAEVQTSGRGRHDRKWHSPGGLNLYFSVLLKAAEIPVRRQPLLAMLTAACLHKTVVDALAAVACTEAISLKWPNDVWLDGRKISGILCESVLLPKPSVILGIGVNVNADMPDFPEELRKTASSLRMVAGHLFSRERILADFLNRLERDFLVWRNSPNGDQELLDYWNRFDMLKGREIVVTDCGRRLAGMAMGVADNGFLRLKLDDGHEMHVCAGDVHISGIEGVQIS